MAFWSTITGIFSSKKNTETVVDTAAGVVDGIKRGIDALVLTDEERIKYTQKGAEQFLQFMDFVAKENTEQSKARRELAKMTFKVYFALLLIGVTVYGFNTEMAKFIFEVAGEITWLVTAVAALYFGPHQLSKVWTKDPKR